MRPFPVEPSNKRAAIGERLRAVRQTQQLTIDQVASAAGLSKGFISRVERDMTSPSVASLVALCEVLSLPIGALFESSEAHLVKSGTGPHINLGGTGAEEWLLTPRGENRLQLVHSRYQPGGDGGKELYTVNSDIEVLHVLDGAVTLRFSSRDWRLAKGDSMTFDGREPHSWLADDQLGAEVLWILAPAAWSGTT